MAHSPRARVQSATFKEPACSTLLPPRLCLSLLRPYAGFAGRLRSRLPSTPRRHSTPLIPFSPSLRCRHTARQTDIVRPSVSRACTCVRSRVSDIDRCADGRKEEEGERGLSSVGVCVTGTVLRFPDSASAEVECRRELRRVSHPGKRRGDSATTPPPPTCWHTVSEWANI